MYYRFGNNKVQTAACARGRKDALDSLKKKSHIYRVTSFNHMHNVDKAIMVSCMPVFFFFLFALH